MHARLPTFAHSRLQLRTGLPGRKAIPDCAGNCTESLGPHAFAFQTGIKMSSQSTETTVHDRKLPNRSLPPRKQSELRLNRSGASTAQADAPQWKK